jgi:hypothetical protein
MSTQRTTTSTNAYNPAAMGVYNQGVGTFGNVMNSFANDPYSNTFFNQQAGMMRQQNATQQASGMQALMQNQSQNGLNPNSPAFLQQQQQMQRQGMAQNAQGYNNLLLNAANTRFQAANALGNFHPLQTGGTQVQSQSGLGTWLPQVAGMALGAGMSAATGGMSNMFGGGGGGGSSPSFQGGDPNAPYMPGYNPAPYNPFTQSSPFGS